MFGILTIVPPGELSAGKRAALRLRPAAGLDCSEGVFRMALFAAARVTVHPDWREGLREKRVAAGLHWLRAKGVREAVLPEEWRPLARKYDISAIPTAAAREACAVQAVAEACRSMGLPLKEACLLVCGRRISRPAAMQVLSLAKSVRTVRVRGEDNDALRAQLWRSCGIVDRGPMPEDAPVVTLCLPGGQPEGESLITVDMTEQGAEGEGLWWRPRLLPPEGALARLPKEACPEALAAALLRCGAVQAREIHVSRLDIPEYTQYNKETANNC